jgi:hypothetical protein
MSPETTPSKTDQPQTAINHPAINHTNDLSFAEIRMSLRELELALKRQELKAIEKEEQEKVKGKDRKFISSPLTVAIFTGIVGLMAAATASFFQSKATLKLEQAKFDFSSQQEGQKATATKELEQQKFESTLVLKAIETGDTAVAARNLQFLIDADYLHDKKGQIAKYIKDPAGKGPVLPRPGTSVLSQTNQTNPVVTSRDPFGNPIRFQKADESGRVKFLDNWEKENVISVAIPQLIGIKGFPTNGAVLFNKNAAEALKAAWAEITDKGLLNRVESWDGSYHPWAVRGASMTLSSHAYAIAFDINAADNPFGKTPPPIGSKGSVLELVPIFEKHGFAWGGNFTTRPDAMHFYYKAPSK